MLIGSMVVAVIIALAVIVSVHAGYPAIRTSLKTMERVSAPPEPDIPQIDFSYDVVGCLSCESGDCEDMEFTVDGDDLTYYHYAEMIYNCCATMIVQFEMDEATIRFIELEHFEEPPCWCLCDYELTGTVYNLPSGEYTVEVWGYFYDGETQTLLCQTTIII